MSKEHYPGFTAGATWRGRAQFAIQRVIKQHPHAQGESLRKLLRDAYPFGERKYHPYKVWLEEVKSAVAAHVDASTLLTGRQACSVADYSDMPLFLAESDHAEV